MAYRVGFGGSVWKRVLGLLAFKARPSWFGGGKGDGNFHFMLWFEIIELPFIWLNYGLAFGEVGEEEDWVKLPASTPLTLLRWVTNSLPYISLSLGWAMWVWQQCVTSNLVRITINEIKCLQWFDSKIMNLKLVRGYLRVMMPMYLE